MYVDIRAKSWNFEKFAVRLTLVKWLPGSRRDPAKNPASYWDLAGK